MNHLMTYTLEDSGGNAYFRDKRMKNIKMNFYLFFSDANQQVQVMDLRVSEASTYRPWNPATVANLAGDFTPPAPSTATRSWLLWDPWAENWFKILSVFWLPDLMNRLCILEKHLQNLVALTSETWNKMALTLERESLEHKRFRGLDLHQRRASLPITGPPQDQCSVT